VKPPNLGELETRLTGRNSLAIVYRVITN
jgi:hypothetical protein